MLAIHKPFPTFKTTTFGTLAFVVGLGGTIGLLAFVRPHNTDTGQSTANVVSSPSSPDAAKKSTTGNTSTNTDKTASQAPTADPQPAARPVYVAPVSQQPANYLQPSSTPVVQNLAAPAPTSTQSSTSTASSTPSSTTQTTTTTTPPADPISGSTGVISGTLQGTVDGIPVDPTLSVPLP